jgi:SAM-dependent methyltransferase
MKGKGMPREEVATRPAAVRRGAEACLLCGSAEAKLVLTARDRLFGIASGTYSLVECRGCGLVRLSPRPTPEEVAGFYVTNYWFAGGALTELYRRMVLVDHVRFAARAARDTNLPGRILDVGCGGGLFLRMMKERGFDCLGLDFSAEAARVAWEVNGVRVLTGDLTTAQIEPESCALITMYHVAEHLLDPAAYLHAASRLLRPEGRLIVQVPDRDCWEAAMLGERWTGLDVPRHIHVFRSSDLRRLLRSCGFEPVREKHFSLRDHPAGLATGLVPSLDPVVRSIRGIDGSAATRLVKDVVYLGIVAAALPFTLFEALFGKGSSVMIEARKIA